ncbi:MAG: hypothetical protein ACJ71O_03765 [Nitrososphaeraceae archaeon]
MKKQYAIPIILGVSILLAAISTSLLPLQQQFASGAGNTTGGPPANTTGGPPANTTGA